MKSKYFFIYLIFIIGLFSCKKEVITDTELNSCAVLNSQTSSSHPKSAQFQNLIKTYINKGLPGLNLYVKDPKGLFIGSGGLADIENKIPMTPCHIGKAASLTKIIVGVAVMKLQEEGKLSLDDPIAKYIDAAVLKKISNGEEKITIRNLLNHTTGFFDVITDQGFYLQVLNNPTKFWKSDELLEFVYGKKADFMFDPPKNAGYSNTNTLLVSMIIEKVTGRPHGEILHEKVIDRLNMNDTYYHWHDKLPEGRVAQGYFDLYNNHSILKLSNWNTGSGNGYGGIYSTVEDLAVFIQALFENKILLKQQSLDQMLVFHPSIESRKNLGVACFKDFIDIGNPDKDYAFGHRGRDLAYTADLNYFPVHQATLAIMCNYGTDSSSDLKQVYLDFRDEVASLIVEN